jgi:uncharacterized protein YgiM (DUF1202 family)
MSPRLERRRALTPAAIVVAVLSLVAGMLTFTPPAPAQAAALPSSILEGGFIISDAEFFDSDSMTAAQIQSFLNARMSTCKAKSGDPTCLKSFKTDLPKKAADRYCKAVAAKKGATAAQVIAAAAAACGINPKVILVMLQKEQGLVTSTAPSEWAYRAAMGQACPDTAPCDEAAAGFVNQVYKGARQLQVYTQNPTSFNYRAGQVNTIKWHPTSSCGSSKVFIQNQATANLYIYTPYRPNVAALAAGSATGDSCSAYGNRNFYNYYVSWFAPGSSTSTGSPAQVAACTVPPSADIAAASGTATVTASSTAGKKAPTRHCTSGQATLEKNDTVSVTGAYGAWIRVKSGSKTMWVLKSALKLSSTGTPAAGGSVCALPAESSVTKASGTAVVATATLNARKAPSTSCDTGRVQIKMGASYKRTATYGVWWRITISGAPYWVHSAYVSLQSTSTPAPVPTPRPTPTQTTTPPKPTPTPTASPTPSASPTPTPSETPVAVTKTRYLTKATQLRTAPGASSVVSTLVTATKVSVTSTKAGWSAVTVGSATGWVETSRLNAKKPSLGKTSTLQASKSVVVRVAVSSKSKAVKTLSKGTKVTVVDKTSKWRAVTVGSTKGWVLASSLKALPQKTTMKTTASLNVRAKATISSKIIVTLKKGAKVTVTASSGSWRKVSVSGKTGWVHGKYLTAVTTKKTMTATANVNLRSSASTSAKIITLVKKGSKVTVTASSGKWRKATVGGKTGWIHGDYLK